MAQSINRIFNMTMTIRNLLGSSRFITSVRLLQNSHNNFISEKGTSNILQPQPSEFTEMSDIMKQRNQFKWCVSSSQVFEMVNNSKSISGHEAVNALKALCRIDKENKGCIESIKKKKEFIALCEVIKKNLRGLSEGNVIDALKVLLHFDVPVTSIIVESLLQMIRQSLNSLTLEQMSFLHYLLTRVKVKTPLVETLKLALPIVFEVQIKTKLDTENIDAMVNALKFLYLLSGNNNNEAINYVMNSLKERSDFKLKHPDHAVDILITLYNIKDSKKYSEFSEKLQQIIIQNVDDIDLSRLEFIIRKMALKIKYSDHDVYNEALIESIIQTVISKNVKVDLALNILGSLNKIRFVSTSLLDYVAAKCYEDNSIINKLNQFQILDMLCAMSLADYKPIFWDSLKDLLLNEKLLQFKHSVMVKTALFLASLDYYWPELINRIFEDENCRSKNIATEAFFEIGGNLLLLHHAVSNFSPDYTGKLLSDDILEAFRNTRTPPRNNYQLKSALELSLGGPQYIKTHVETEFKLCIDHVVIMRKGGFPIAINPDDEKSPLNLSDLQLIPDSQVLLFMYISPSLYARNTLRLTGIGLLRIKLLKSKLNYTVIPVISSMWDNFTNLEKSRYISQAIKLKSDKLSASINS
ncbi:GSCOCG00001739001-RA-CDS [Cotesia congregata]|nr:GSCOCG00001739001-RA-CDS [Cotesia congregata]